MSKRTKAEEAQWRLDRLVSIVRFWVDNDGCTDYDGNATCSDRSPNGPRGDWCAHCQALAWLEEEDARASRPVGERSRR
jgi:hypothetical protein